MGFGYLFGLYALAAILPFILIYLIRPKSFLREIPSLMFLMKEHYQSKKSSFLRKFFQNPLFFLQLLIILMLGLGAAEPFLDVSRSLVVKNSVIVLDASGSMHAKSGASSRWSEAVSEAKNHLGLRNTLILAQNVPVIMLEGGTKREAQNLLGSLFPKATGSNLGDAMLLAGDLAGERRSVITVLSDFMVTEGSDVLIAKQSLEAKGHAVNFFPVGGDGKNIGIIGLSVDSGETLVTVKNFDDAEKSIKVSLQKEGKRVGEKGLVLQPGSSEKVVFATPQGQSRIVLEPEDSLSLDNVAFLSSPLRQDIKVLLITNRPEGNAVKAALNAIDGVKVEIREPPTINAYSINHDLVVISDVSSRLFVPTDFRDIAKYVEKGGLLVFAAQENFTDVSSLLVREGLQEILPITPKEVAKQQSDVCVTIIGPLFGKDPFADEPCFTSVNGFVKADAQNGTSIIANAAFDRSPVIAHKKYGRGEILYYGIMDRFSGFYTDPYYPILWQNILFFMLKAEDISALNKKSGQFVAVKNPRVKSPSAELEVGKLFLDEAGIYEYDGKKVAVNMLEEAESAIGQEVPSQWFQKVALPGDSEKNIERFDLGMPLLAIALLLLLLEIVYVKIRGDL